MKTMGKKFKVVIKSIPVLPLLFLGTPSDISTAVAQSVGTFTATGDMVTAQLGHTAILLRSGKVLFVGGVTVYPTAAPAELYDASTGTFAPTGVYAGTGLCDFCPPAVLLPDGRVLFGGQYPAQLYDPVSGTFRLTGAMADPDHSTATLLMNGKVVVAGGVGLGRSFT